MKTTLIIFGLSLLFCANVFAQSEADKKIFRAYITAITPADKDVSTGTLMTNTAKYFIGRPYVGATLESEPEQLVTNLRELDCMTLVETTTALVRTIHSEECTFETFCDKLQDARYRNATITDYTSRLHYTTDWMYENEKKNIVKDITKEIGGRPWKVEVGYMSAHPGSYKQLSSHPELIARIADKEKEINLRQYYYIPKNEISQAEPKIKDGDIIGFVTSVKGLDIAHVGIACRSNGKLSFIHASSDKMKVILNEEPLQDYINRIKNNIGIVVMRPQF